MTDDSGETLEVVRGGGFEFLTADPILIAVVNRCEQLKQRAEAAERENEKLRHQEVARFRTMRRDVAHIKKAVRGIVR